jgi:hypothetical protein
VRLVTPSKVSLRNLVHLQVRQPTQKREHSYVIATMSAAIIDLQWAKFSTSRLGQCCTMMGSTWEGHDANARSSSRSERRRRKSGRSTSIGSGTFRARNVRTIGSVRLRPRTTFLMLPACERSTVRQSAGFSQYRRHLRDTYAG